MQAGSRPLKTHVYTMSLNKWYKCHSTCHICHLIQAVNIIFAQNLYSGESVGRISFGSHRLHDSDVIQVLDLWGFGFEWFEWFKWFEWFQWFEGLKSCWDGVHPSCARCFEANWVSCQRLTNRRVFHVFPLRAWYTSCTCGKQTSQWFTWTFGGILVSFSVVTVLCFSDLILHTVCNLVPIRPSTHAIILYEYNAVEGQWGSPSIEAKTVWKCLKSVDQGFQTKRQFGICFRTLAGNIRRSSLATSFFIVEASPHHMCDM